MQVKDDVCYCIGAALPFDIGWIIAAHHYFKITPIANYRFLTKKGNGSKYSFPLTRVTPRAEWVDDPLMAFKEFWESNDNPIQN